MVETTIKKLAASLLMNDRLTAFSLYRKLVVSYKAKNAPRGCASRGEEVSCKQLRSSAKESQATLCSYESLIKNYSLFL